MALTPEERAELGRIRDMDDAATQDYLRRSSLTYLECCISLMLTHMSRDEVAQVLESEAQMVSDLG